MKFALTSVLTILSRPLACPDDRAAHPKCETTGGSPLASDCQIALGQISDQCQQISDGFSQCTTVARHGSCKIDVCGERWTSLQRGINCGGYLQAVLNSCKSGGRVGGQISPSACNINYPSYGGHGPYRLQFSRG